MIRTHTCWELNSSNIGQETTLWAWVNKIRNLWGLYFIDLRDRYGITQITIDPNDTQISNTEALLSEIKNEYVLKITGTVKSRPESMINKDMKTGEIEIHPQDIQILSTCGELPFSIDHENPVWEDIRLEYRYLDLRRESMRKILEIRSKIYNETLKFFEEENFITVETPCLIKNTPEGSRELIVPSRLSPGEFFVLPQSPQQLKQMLMVAGIDKYIQIARCFRDEDPRWDRQIEFTQVDFEMSFVDQEAVIAMIEKYCLHLATTIFPQKKILETKTPHIKRVDCMNTYGSDKPELRTKQLQITELTERAHTTDFSIFKNAPCVKAMLVPKTLSRSEIEKELEPVIKENGGKWLAYLIFDNGEVRGGIAKFFNEEQINKLKEITKVQDGQSLLFQATQWLECVELLWAIRNPLIKKLNLLEWKEEELSFTFVVDFPMFELNNEGNLSAMHHPFTKPKDDQIPRIKSLWRKIREWYQITDEDKQKLIQVESDGYDIILNGYELGGGSIRIHDKDLQDAIFAILGLNAKQTQERFGHLLKSFSFGVPPHGGCGLGFDRIVMVLQNLPNIREAIAFPKNQKMQDLMLKAPSSIDQTLLDELNISIKAQS